MSEDSKSQLDFLWGATGIGTAEVILFVAVMVIGALCFGWLNEVLGKKKYDGEDEAEERLNRSIRMPDDSDSDPF